MLLDKLFRKKHYWYQVKYVYNVKGTILFNWQSQIGIIKQNDIINPRKIKKIAPPLHMQENIPKNLLQNGILDVEVICYLGRISK